MIYDIKSQSNLSGVTLTVRFPESELDRKALRTIQEDQPPFLIPFQYRNVDGQAECSYQLGRHTKLQYRYGTRDPQEYVEFWTQVFQPLLDCDDWFLKPLSFVLEPQYIYVDRAGTIYYLYVPSRKDCVEFSAIQALARELSQHNTVTDTNLENQALKAIMQDFQPKAFLQMLRESLDKAQAPDPKKQKHGCNPVPVSAAAVAKPIQSHDEPIQSQPVQEPDPQSAYTPVNAGISDDIVIDLDSVERAEKPKGWGLFGGKKEKKAPASPKWGSLFGGKKKTKDKEILLGAAAESPQPVQPQSLQSQTDNVSSSGQILTTIAEDLTEMGEDSIELPIPMPVLRLVSTADLTKQIKFFINPGEAFTIGRFDVSVGRQQSDFEFDAHTLAVSRRHAAIERDASGAYFVVDLDSRAGTFLNGKKLVPNVPHPLVQGCRVCFGTGGADYCWNEPQD